MSKANPFHIVILLVVILLFLVLKLHIAKDELAHAKKSYKEVQNVAMEIEALENIYNNKNKNTKLLQKILKNPVLKGVNIDKKFTNLGATIVIKSADKKVLNFLMAKVLNNSFNIDSFKIQRLSDENVSLKMEIRW